MHWRQLGIWKKSHELAKDIYKVTLNFPREELYGLTSQLRRATVSIPTNIVEDFSRNTTKEYVSFLYNSRGSLEEVRYLLYLSLELELIAKQTYTKLEQQFEEISKMLNALIKSLKSKLK